jgi:hypothetical protein
LPTAVGRRNACCFRELTLYKRPKLFAWQLTVFLFLHAPIKCTILYDILCLDLPLVLTKLLMDWLHPASFSLEVHISSSNQKIPRILWVPKSSLKYTQQPTSCPYPCPD